MKRYDVECQENNSIIGSDRDLNGGAGRIDNTDSDSVVEIDTRDPLRPIVRIGGKALFQDSPFYSRFLSMLFKENGLAVKIERLDRVSRDYDRGNNKQGADTRMRKAVSRIQRRSAFPKGLRIIPCHYAYMAAPVYRVYIDNYDPDCFLDVGDPLLGANVIIRSWKRRKNEPQT